MRYIDTKSTTTITTFSDLVKQPSFQELPESLENKSLEFTEQVLKDQIPFLLLKYHHQSNEEHKHKTHTHAHHFMAVIQLNLHQPRLRTRGFCWSKVLLAACPCWRQLVHWDFGEDAGVLLSGVTFTMSTPHAQVGWSRFNGALNTNQILLCL